MVSGIKEISKNPAPPKEAAKKPILKYVKNERKIISGKTRLNKKLSFRRLSKAQKEAFKKRMNSRTKKAVKSPRFPRAYLIQKEKEKIQLRKVQCFKSHKRHIRSSIKPGSVLILLAGRHKGKRVVCLKALDSGLLLVTGPFKYNGVPLRRVNQRFVIATKTRVRMNAVRIPKKIDDNFFRRVDLKPKTKNIDKLFAEEPKKYAVSDDRKKLQKEVDKSLIASITKGKSASMLSSYLKSMFSLSKKEYPHKMIF